MLLRPLVKSVKLKNDFLISQPKPMLWVLKIPVSMRRIYRAHKTYVKTDWVRTYLKFYTYLDLIHDASTENIAVTLSLQSHNQ